MDIPLALVRLIETGRILASDDWGSGAQTGASYESFVAGWRGVSAVPTQAELDAAWTYLEGLGGADGFDTRTARAQAADAVDNDRSAELKLLRGALAVLVDEVNTLRQRLAAQDTVVANATTLTNLKSAWATMVSASPMPDRTLTQARTAIKAKINAGTVD